MCRCLVRRSRGQNAPRRASAGHRWTGLKSAIARQPHSIAFLSPAWRAVVELDITAAGTSSSQLASGRVAIRQCDLKYITCSWLSIVDHPDGGLSVSAVVDGESFTIIEGGTARGGGKQVASIKRV